MNTEPDPAAWKGDENHPLKLVSRERSFVIHDRVWLGGYHLAFLFAVIDHLSAIYRQHSAWAVASGETGMSGAIAALEILNDDQPQFFVPAFSSSGGHAAEVQIAVRVNGATLKKYLEHWLAVSPRFIGVGWWVRPPQPEEIFALESCWHARLNPETLPTAIVLPQTAFSSFFYTTDSIVASAFDRIALHYCQELRISRDGSGAGNA